MMQPTERDLEYLEFEEGVVLKAYKDPTGTWTIGTGFTNASRVVTRHVGKIKRGVLITAEQNRTILKEAINEEYGPPVERKMPGAKHHELIAGLSITWNVGERVLDWKWAQAWRAGDKKRAAQLMEVTATTSKGQKLAGLVARRKREAAILLSGIYPSHVRGSAVATKPGAVIGAKTDEILREYQGKLRKLGFDPGLVDGRSGPLTTGAVRKFQEKHPDLIADGILGKATMAQIDRALDLVSRGTKQAAGGAAVISSAGGLAISWPVGLALGGAFLAIMVVILAVKYWAELKMLVTK